LVFFKRLSDVFEDEFAAHVKEYGDEDLARTITCRMNKWLPFCLTG
jgi:type I restriction-modification system DNA methylase subunit